jgi:hypothetical protein
MKKSAMKSPYPEINPTIVVSAYNRPQALSRLLQALAAANYPGDQQVRLHISIDRGEGNAAQKVRRLSQEFNWPHGPKQVVCHAEHLGLLKHFFLCGQLACQYEAIILLEDDLLVSPQFYNYATQALTFYGGDERIAGISLYALWFNGYTHFPFTPLPDASDIFFLQIPYTQGQAFTKEHWLAFEEWHASPGQHNWINQGVHEMFTHFDAEDWFPVRTRYLVETRRYYVFPRQSLATGFGDAGTHFSQLSHFFQVALQNYQDQFRLLPFDQAPAVYDSFFEILPERLDRLTERFHGFSYCVDLNGTKSRNNLNAEYVLTTRPARQVAMNFGRLMRPPEANLIAGVPGDGIHLCRKEDLLWGYTAELAVRKGNYDYAARKHPLGRKELAQFAFYEWMKRLRIWK